MLFVGLRCLLSSASTSRLPMRSREVYAEFHKEQTDEVDDGLLCPPAVSWGLAVVTAAKRFGWVGEGCERGAVVEEAEEDD
jgi:hypothetical protein